MNGLNIKKIIKYLFSDATSLFKNVLIFETISSFLLLFNRFQEFKLENDNIVILMRIVWISNWYGAVTCRKCKR